MTFEEKLLDAKHEQVYNYKKGKLSLMQGEGEEPPKGWDSISSNWDRETYVYVVDFVNRICDMKGDNQHKYFRKPTTEDMRKFVGIFCMLRSLRAAHITLPIPPSEEIFISNDDE